MGLMRERAKAALLGAAAAGGAYVSTQAGAPAAAVPATDTRGLLGQPQIFQPERLIWRSTAQVADSIPGGYAPAAPQEEPERLLGAYARATLIRSWNQAVDRTFTVLIEGVLTREAPTEQLCE